jgi:hypothetical protein
MIPFRGHALGSRLPRWPYPSARWVQEAERLVVLDGRLPAVLRGVVRPADAAECLAFALLCQRYKRRYDGSARFYAEAFAARPDLAGDLPAGHCYNAACAAALAASGQGEDAAFLDGRGRARWRREALTWLRADLALWAKRLEDGKPADRSLVQKTLRHWRADANLASLRDKDALAKLPEGERQACVRLWADVDALLKRAGATPAMPVW